MADTKSLVYGYVLMEEPEETGIALLCKDLATFCALNGLRLGSVFIDRGVPDEAFARTGFTDLLAAVRLTTAHAVPVQVQGELELLTGARLWPDGWSDAIAIRDVGDARSFRCDPLGGEVWKREGSLIEVIDGLVELPAPDEPGAPRLVPFCRGLRTPRITPTPT